MFKRDMPRKDVIGYYRTVFSTPAGRAVLRDMLDEMGVFRVMPVSADDVAVRNYGIMLMTYAIGGGEINDNTVDAFLHKLMQQPIKDD
jgi:hypothetical protein